MIEKEIAKDIKKHAMAAITELVKITTMKDQNFSIEEIEAIKKAVGIPIGMIQTNLLEFLYKYYPELDNLS